MEQVYINLENYIKNNIVSWKDTIGKIIKFKYNGMEKECKIISVDFKSQRLYILYENSYISISSDDFKNGKMDFILKNERVFKYNINDILKDDRRDLIIIDRFYYKTKLYKVKCNKCGYEKVVSESELDNIKHTYICACCSSKIVVPGINDIPTTDPWMIPYFQGGEEEARLYMHSSSAKLYLRCPFCGKITDKAISISSLYNSHGIACTCKDNISYPEKVMLYILNSLNINYIYQANKDILPWAENFRYDFFLKEKNTIIETHGEQHYKNENCLYNKQNKIKEADDKKRNLAKLNKIKYIELNCSKSDINFIKNNILNSELFKLLELDKFDIDWDKCDSYGRKNLIYEVCLFFNNNTSLTVDELSEHFKLERSTIIKYLHIGTNLSWCNYDSKEKLRVGQKKTADIMNQRRVEKNGFIYIYDNDQLICKTCNGHEASRICKEKGYNISPGFICYILRNPNKNMGKGLLITYGK